MTSAYQTRRGGDVQQQAQDSPFSLLYFFPPSTNCTASERPLFRRVLCRRPPTTTAGAEGRSFSSEHDEETPDAAALNASAIRNVLLALTDQPLIPSSPKPAQTSPPAAQALTFRQAPTTVPGLGLAQNSIHLPTPASSLLWTEALPGAGASDMEQNSPSSSCSSGSPNGGVSEPGVGGEAFSRTAGYPDLETGDLGGRRDGAGSRAPSSVEGGGKDEPGSRTQHRARRGRSFLSREVEAQDDTSSDDEPYESASEEVVKPTHEVAFHRWAFGTQAISLVTNGGDNCCKGLGGPGKCNATSSRSRNLAHERIGCVGSTGDEARRRGVDEVWSSMKFAYVRRYLCPPIIPSWRVGVVYRLEFGLGGTCCRIRGVSPARRVASRCDTTHNVYS